MTRARFRILTALTAGLVLLGAGTAYADDVSNTIDSSVDSTVETLNLVLGPNGGTTIKIVATNSDGKNGCNLTGSTTLTIALSSSNPGVATVSPAQITFTSCGDTPAVTVSPVAVGSATVSAALVSNTTSGTFDLAPVTFAVNVTAPPNTAP